MAAAQRSLLGLATLGLSMLGLVALGVVALATTTLPPAVAAGHPGDCSNS
jgi:hypothetical protein